MELTKSPKNFNDSAEMSPHTEASQDSRDLFDSAALKYIRSATSENTRVAYQSDIADFLKRGGELPASAAGIVNYLQQSATRLNPRTLRRRLIAIRTWHRLKKLVDPTDDPVVKSTMRGISRQHGTPRKQAKALRLQDLDVVVTFLQQQGSKSSVRSRALFLVGFFGAFRSSELIGLHWEQIEFESDGMIVNLQRSKTDQVGEGSQSIIPFGNDTRCPVRALLDWREVSKKYSGPIFRRISKSGTIAEKSICADYLTLLIRRVIKQSGIPGSEQYSSHSLRRGFATEASRLGASMPAIKRHGRWRSTKTVLEYIDAGRQFKDSAVNLLFEF